MEKTQSARIKTRSSGAHDTSVTTGAKNKMTEWSVKRSFKKEGKYKADTDKVVVYPACLPNEREDLQPLSHVLLSLNATISTMLDVS